MVHPDYQYTPKLIPAMVSLIDNELYNCVLGSRILGGYAYRNGMPYWRYIANRFLTLFGNIMMGAKLAEYHTGYRAYSRELLKEIDFEKNSDDFVFDNQILAQILWCDYAIVEISCPARYMLESSSIDFRRSVRYGFAVTFLPVVFFSGFLPNNNPFAVQNIFLPVWFPVIVLLVMTLAAFWIRSLGKFIFYSMIAMTVMVTAYFFIQVIDFDLYTALINDGADISYFILSLPFLLFCLVKIVDRPFAGSKPTDVHAAAGF